MNVTDPYSGFFLWKSSVNKSEWDSTEKQVAKRYFQGVSQQTRPSSPRFNPAIQTVCSICRKIPITSLGLMFVQKVFLVSLFFLGGGWGWEELIIVGFFALQKWFGLYLEGISCLKIRGFASENAAPEGMWVLGDGIELPCIYGAIGMLPRNTSTVSYGRTLNLSHFIQHFVWQHFCMTPCCGK